MLVKFAYKKYSLKYGNPVEKKVNMISHITVNTVTKELYTSDSAESDCIKFDYPTDLISLPEITADLEKHGYKWILEF